MAESEVIRICLGSEPMQYIPCEVLKSSILRRTQRPVAFYESWTPATGWHDLCSRYHRTSGTLFSHWRWIAPELFPEKTGKVIYLDADQAVFADIGELYDALDSDHTIACVIGAEGLFGDKIPDRDAVETSVMVVNLERCAWHPKDLLDQVKSGKMVYSYLMRARWMDRNEVQRLDCCWNYFNSYVPGVTKLLHWTKVREQPYRNPKHRTSGIFAEELRESVRCGHIAQGALLKEIKRGNIHEDYRKVLK